MFNRDESRTRALAEPPRRHLGPQGVAFLAPVDAAEGGTWILVNQHGLVLALLNNYQAQAPPVPSPRSRGLLMLELAGESGVEALVLRLSELPLEAFRGFHLLALGVLGGAAIFDWDGRRLSFDRSPHARMPLISSGYDLPGVRAARQALFERMLGGGQAPAVEQLRQFQASPGEPLPGREPWGAYGVRMSRGDARTVSQTEVHLGPELARLRYRPVPEDPGAPLPDFEVELALEIGGATP